MAWYQQTWVLYLATDKGDIYINHTNAATTPSKYNKDNINHRLISDPECSDFSVLIFKGLIQKHTRPPKLHFVFTRMHNLWYWNMSKYTYSSHNYSKSWRSKRHWMSQKVLLNINLHRPITFHYSVYQQHSVPILRQQTTSKNWKINTI